MATHLASKTASEVVERRWSVPVDSNDGASAAVLSATGVTIDADSIEGNELVLTLSGGTAAATGTITATMTTEQGRTLVETLYIPIIASPAQIADTARDYVAFALRKTIGLGKDARATELDDALERLNALIAEWREGGADIGCAFPITANTVIYCPDYAARALRYNLLIECASLYGAEVSGMDMERARRGLQIVKHKNLPAERKAEYF